MLFFGVTCTVSQLKADCSMQGCHMLSINRVLHTTSSCAGGASSCYACRFPGSILQEVSVFGVFCLMTSQAEVLMDAITE